MNEENKKTMKPTFDEVMRLDQNLQYLATYEVTGGRILVPRGAEEMIKLTTEVADKFNYFKKLIHDGECTYEFIKSTVLAKNGPYPQNKKGLDFEDPKCFLEDDALEIMTDPKEAMQTFVEKLVGSLFPGAKLEKIEYTGGIQSDSPQSMSPHSNNAPTDDPPAKTPAKKDPPHPKTKKKNKKRK